MSVSSGGGIDIFRRGLTALLIQHDKRSHADLVTLQQHTQWDTGGSSPRETITNTQSGAQSQENHYRTGLLCIYVQVLKIKKVIEYFFLTNLIQSWLLQVIKIGSRFVDGGRGLLAVSDRCHGVTRRRHHLCGPVCSSLLSK